MKFEIINIKIILFAVSEKAVIIKLTESDTTAVIKIYISRSDSIICCITLNISL